MLSAEQRDALNRMGPYASAYDLGKIIHQTQACAVGTWSYTRDGGATGTDYSLKDINGINLTIPSGAIITNCVLVATAAVTSSGSLTLDVNVEAANDCVAAAAKADMEINERVQGIPDTATVADWVRLTAERTPTITLNVAAATAGAVTVFFWYVIP